MSAEQGDVETVREALTLIPDGHVLTHHEALAALDRLAAALERAEREAERLLTAGQQIARAGNIERVRAEKAERALAEMHAYFCGCTAAVCHALRPSEDSA